MFLQRFSFFISDLLGQIATKIRTSPAFAPCVLFFALIFAVLICYAFFCLGKKFGIAELKAEFNTLLKASRKDAVKRSRAVLSGQMAEQIAPFLRDFPCNPADVRFVGKPLDFIGFPGASDGSGIKEILFIEVKTGNSALSSREKEIKEAVNAGKVRYVEYNPAVDSCGGAC